MERREKRYTGSQCQNVIAQSATERTAGEKTGSDERERERENNTSQDDYLF